MSPTQRWIESLNSEWPMNVTKESFLPKGEGLDEGEARFIIRRRVICCRSEKLLSTESFLLKP
jgi:hypothetical protein